jgi:DNA-binding MarR family transcriptional regulator
MSGKIETEDQHPAEDATARVSIVADQISRDLSNIRKLLRQPLDAEVAKGNLTGPQRAVMQVVVREEGISLKELSAQIGLAQSTVSGIVDRLAQRGIIERRSDPSDRRATRIYPSAPVVEFMKEQMPRLISDPLRRALSMASEQEAAEIQRAFNRLRELLEAPQS